MILLWKVKLFKLILGKLLLLWEWIIKSFPFIIFKIFNNIINKLIQINRMDHQNKSKDYCRKLNCDLYFY